MDGSCGNAVVDLKRYSLCRKRRQGHEVSNDECGAQRADQSDSFARSAWPRSVTSLESTATPCSMAGYVGVWIRHLSPSTLRATGRYFPKNPDLTVQRCGWTRRGCRGSRPLLLRPGRRWPNVLPTTPELATYAAHPLASAAFEDTPPHARRTVCRPVNKRRPFGGLRVGPW
jgi:hypothetical protein